MSSRAREEMTTRVGDYECRVSPISAVTGAVAAVDRSLIEERDPAVAFSEATGNSEVTAAGAAKMVTTETDSSVTG